jgi:hypothetical protein
MTGRAARSARLVLGWLALVACGSAQSAARTPASEPEQTVLHTASVTPLREQPARGRTRKVTPAERRAIAELIAAAEQVRGLHFAREVPVLVQDSDAIMAYVDSQIETDRLERARVVYSALGLLPPELDVHALLLRLMGEQIVGYYDVEQHRLVVRDDVMRAFGGAEDQAVDLTEARVVLVHELVHALQDQHLGLSISMHEERDSDAENAFHALVEGDATLAMIAFAMQQQEVPLSELTRNPARVQSLSQLVQSSPLAGTELGGAPAIVRVPLLSAYVDGLTFAANLHGDGGWGRVNRAHADPPASSEQVLHPERFVRRDVPQRLHLDDAKAALGADYELIHEDTLGELELAVYFGQAGGERPAQRAAQGWGGDRLYAYRAANREVSIVWLLVFDDEREAREAEEAAQRVRSAAPEAERAEHLAQRSGRALLVLRHVPATLHAAVRARFEQWASAEQSADARAD